MKKKLTKIGLQNRLYVISYYDTTLDEGVDSTTLTYDDISTPETYIVADVYDYIIDDYLDLLKVDGIDVVSYGRYSRAGNTGDLAYVSWTEQIKEYREYYSTLEHTDIIALYVYLDGQMTLIPYSDEPVTAVTIEDEDWEPSLEAQEPHRSSVFRQAPGSDTAVSRQHYRSARCDKQS